MLVGLVELAGCSRFKGTQHEFVYVSARQVYLHDRVAAVSNRVGMVTNGQALEVVERGKRFVKVKTAKGEIGWLEDHAVIDDKLYAQYEALGKAHAQDPAVATAQLRDDLYLHLAPGRETPHFLLIPGNARVQLLERGTVERAPAPGILPSVKPKPPAAPAGQTGQGGQAAVAPSATAQESSGAGKAAEGKTAPGAAGSATAGASHPAAGAGGDAANAPAPALVTPPAAPPAMEDWWLVRDGQGHTGWLLAGRLDVDVPDEVGAYAEGQRMVGAYPIAKVMDYEGGVGLRERKAGKAADKHAETAAKAKDAAGDTPAGADAPQPKEMTEYLTVLTPPRGGLPFDFDQIRVFTWSLNHHRYETAYRLHGIQGYLPVHFSQETVNGQSMPVFSFAISDGPDVTVDPDTGVTRPAHPRTIAFRLEGNLVRRTGADQAPIILTHPSDEPGAKKPEKKKKR